MTDTAQLQPLLDPIQFIKYSDLAKAALGCYSKAMVEALDLRNQIANYSTKDNTFTLSRYDHYNTECSTETMVARKTELEKRLQELETLIGVVDNALSELPDDQFAVLMISELRRRKKLSWTTVAEQRMNISKSSAYRIRDAALGNLGEIMSAGTAERN